MPPLLYRIIAVILIPALVSQAGWTHSGSIAAPRPVSVGVYPTQALGNAALAFTHPRLLSPKESEILTHFLKIAFVGTSIPLLAATKKADSGAYTPNLQEQIVLSIYYFFERHPYVLVILVTMGVFIIGSSSTIAIQRAILSRRQAKFEQRVKEIRKAVSRERTSKFVARRSSQEDADPLHVMHQFIWDISESLFDRLRSSLDYALDPFALENSLGEALRYIDKLKGFYVYLGEAQTHVLQADAVENLELNGLMEKGRMVLTFPWHRNPSPAMRSLSEERIKGVEDLKVRIQALLSDVRTAKPKSFSVKIKNTRNYFEQKIKNPSTLRLFQKKA